MKESKNVFKLSKAVLNKEPSDEKIDSASDSEPGAMPKSPDKTERKKGTKESKMKLLDSKKEDSEAGKEKLWFSLHS